MSLLEMSLTGAAMILVIVVVRALAIYQLPKSAFLALWGVVAVRLLIPYSLPSALSVYSLLERTAPAATTVAEAETGTVHIPATPSAPIVPAVQPPSLAVSAETAAIVAVDPWTVVWVIGALACAVFFAVAYGKCRREFQASLPVDNGYVKQWLSEHPIRRRIAIRQSGRISAPLTYGVLRPVILMPKTVDWDDIDTLNYVLAHEYVHIRRFDAVTKLALTAAVCVHWFNPAVWVMYVLANRDIELSCDEAVVRAFGERAKSAYAMALIRMEERRSDLMPLCNGFSKNAIEERIVAIMKIKKTSLAAALVAAVLVAGVTVAFATSAKAGEDLPGNGLDSVSDVGEIGAVTETPEFSFEHTTFRYGEREYDMTLRNPSINSILSAEPVGDKIVVDCHVGPHNGIYCIFDTASETFEKDISGHDLIWHSDDITTAVYAFWSEVYTYAGSLIKNYDLDELAADGGMIYEMRFSDDHTKLYVTIVYDDGAELTDTIDISEITQNSETSNRRENDMRISGNSLTESVYWLYQKNQSSPQETTFNDLLQAAAGDIQNAAEPKIQIWNDYQAWKSQQPKRTLPDSKGATEENIAYLREHFTGELSLYQRIEAVDTMREMGMITEEQMRNAIGIGPHTLKTVTTPLVVTGRAGDRNMEAWSDFFTGLPLMEASDLDDLFKMVDEQLRFTKGADVADEIRAVLDRTTHRIPE